MIRTWFDFDRARPSFASHDELHRQMNALFEEVAGYRSGNVPAGSATTRLVENDDELVVQAALPGVTADQLEIELHDNVLSLSAQRSAAVPEGYRAHRKERRDVRVSRTFTLPVPVDAERVRASLDDGVLTIRLAKQETPTARRIEVTAG